MSAVLAVMDGVVAGYAYMARSGQKEVTIGYDKAEHDKAVNARAAVAELIEATERYLKADLRVSDLKEFGGPEYAHGREWRDATVEHGNAAAALRNALVRCGDGK